MSANRRIVLSGATGFLGSHLLRMLLTKGYDVTVLKRSFSDTRRIQKELSMVRYVDTDVQDIDSAFTCGGSVEAVIHTACVYGRKQETLAEVIDGNVVFGVKLAETASRNGCNAFLNTDTALPRSINQYTLSKKQLVEWLDRMTARMWVANLRIEQMYGPGDDESKFLPWLISQCLKKVPEIPLTAGNQLRDFIYVSDVVNAFFRVLENRKTQGFDQFDIGTGTPVTIKSVVESVIEIFRTERPNDGLPDLQFGEIAYRAGEPMVPELDLTGIRRLGWDANVSLDRGLRTVIADMFSKEGNKR